MGGEGIAIIAALAFVALSVIPTINRRMAIISRTVIDERFAADLRMLNTQPRHERNSHLRGVNLSHETGLERGKIYYSERKMESSAAVEKSHQPVKRENAPSALREAARARAMARVRIQKRHSLQRNLLIGCVVVGVLTIAAWIAVPVAQFPAAYGVAGTLLTMLGAGSYDYTRRNCSEANRVDAQVVMRNTKVLREASERVKDTKKSARNSAAIRNAKRAVDYQSAGSQPAAVNSPEQKVAQARAESANTLRADCDHLENETTRAEHFAVQSARVPVNQSAQNTSEKRNSAAVSAEPGSIRSSAVKSADSAQTSASVPATSTGNVPSYTVKPKIQKRKVAPYIDSRVSAREGLAAVPYRPVRIGERFGDEQLKPANPAPQMTGKEELRSDLLGSGTTLDTLLERRRA